MGYILVGLLWLLFIYCIFKPAQPSEGKPTIMEDGLLEWYSEAHWKAEQAEKKRLQAEEDERNLASRKAARLVEEREQERIAQERLAKSFTDGELTLADVQAIIASGTADTAAALKENNRKLDSLTKLVNESNEIAAAPRWGIGIVG